MSNTQLDAPAGPKPLRRPRADSVRNRERVLEAAEKVFGSEGASAPIGAVAARAGVGVGTVYRHFPTKEALFEAIVRSHCERLVDAARARLESDDAPRALFGLLSDLAELVVDKHDLADALAGAGFDVKATAGKLIQEVDDAIDQLLTRAQRDGSVRRDVSTADLMGLVAGACKSAERSERSGADSCSPARMLAVVCDGLRRTD